MIYADAAFSVLIDDDYGEIWSVYSNAEGLHPEHLFSRSTEQEALEDLVGYLIEFGFIPAWQWSGKITANAFLSARDVFEIQQTCMFLSYQIEIALPS